MIFESGSDIIVSLKLSPFIENEEKSFKSAFVSAKPFQRFPNLKIIIIIKSNSLNHYQLESEIIRFDDPFCCPNCL